MAKNIKLALAMFFCAFICGVQGQELSAPCLPSTHTPEKVAFSLLDKSLKSFLTYPVRELAAGNLVAHLPLPEQSFYYKYKTAEEAKHHLYVQNHIWRGDASGQALANVLIMKKKQGVDVRVFIDTITHNNPGTSAIDIKNSMIMYENMMAAGIPVYGYYGAGTAMWKEFKFLSPTLSNMRFHEKLWCKDSECVVMGGMNITNRYTGASGTQGHKWKDHDVVAYGPVTLDAETAFLQNVEYLEQLQEMTWTKMPNYNPFPVHSLEYEEFYMSHAQNYLRPSDEGEMLLLEQAKKNIISMMTGEFNGQSLSVTAAPATVRFMHHRPRLGDQQIDLAYKSLLDEAQDRVIISNAYFMPSDALKEKLVAASARGVSVHIRTNHPKAGDIEEVAIEAVSDLIELQEKTAHFAHPIQVSLWKGNPSAVDFAGGFVHPIHEKYAIFDSDVSVVGSFNLDPRSRKYNAETALLIQSPQLTTEISQDFYEGLIFSAPLDEKFKNEFLLQHSGVGSMFSGFKRMIFRPLM